ncbi:MAG: TolC family protein [Bacteroidia bacterium]
MFKRIYITSCSFLFFFWMCVVMIFFEFKSYAQPVKGDSIVPLTLQQAIEMGIDCSNKLKAANLEIEIADENVRQKKTNKLPDINLGLDGYLINDPTLYNTTPFGDPEKIDYTPYQLSGSLMVSEVIYAGNRIDNSIKREVLQKKIAESLVVKTTSEIKITVINEYLKLFSQLKDYDITFQTINQIELRLKTLRSKFINGQVVKNDVSRSELQKSDFELKLLRTVSNASSTNYFLTLLLGLPENVVIQVDTSVNYSSDTLFVFEDCLLAAFNNRPEFQIAKTNKELSENTLSLVKGNYYPTINGIGLYGLQNPVPGTFPPEGNFLSFVTIGAGINYNIASLYKTNHQKSSAELAVQLEEEKINDLLTTLSDEVKTQFSEYELQRQSLEIYKKQIQYAEINYKIIQSRYYNDLALISDMVDAELEYSEARLNLIKGQVQTRKEYYKLLKAIGKL